MALSWKRSCSASSHALLGFCFQPDHKAYGFQGATTRKFRMKRHTREEIVESITAGYVEYKATRSSTWIASSLRIQL